MRIVPDMAFTTRSGRTVAVGTGAMTTAFTLTMFSLFLLLPVVAIVVAWLIWLTVEPMQFEIEHVLPQMMTLGVSALGLAMLLQIMAMVCGFTAFIGPKNRFRDQLIAAIQSRTGRRSLAAIALVIILMFLMRYLPFDDTPPIVIVLTVVLVIIEIALVRSLFRLRKSSRARPYFDNLSELQKDRADITWPIRVRPSFANLEDVSSPADAERYARRARDAAELHTWIGAGIIVVFTAFVGMSIAATWESPESTGPLPTLMVLGFIGLGYWIQRRSRVYRSLAEDYMRHRQDLESIQREQALESADAENGVFQRCITATARLFSRSR